MIRLSYIALSMALTLGFTACNDDDYNESGIQSDFKVSRSEVAMASSKPTTITVRAAQTPSVTTDASWLHIGTLASTAPNIYTFDLTADEHTGYDARTGSVIVAAGNDRSTVTVTQYGAETVQIVSTTPGTTLEPNGGTVSIKYAATDEVEITAPDWLTLTPSKALEESTITYTYNGNLGVARTGDVTITLIKDPTISAKVTLTQDATAGSMSSSAREIASRIYAGVNIGNTMEVPGGEGGWGTGKVNLNYIKGLKTLGFNAVRVPCAWDSYVTDEATNTIDPEWLDRVSEVVGWIVNEDMYAIVNIHWDGGWLENHVGEGFNEGINKKQRDYWTQIATRLNGYDEHLLFAGTNEPGMEGSITDAAVDAIVKYQQTFVDAVRATGGNNATRCLIAQGPQTNIDETVKSRYKLPVDVVADRMFVEIHNYDPSDFTIMESDGQWSSTVKLYWGADNFVSGSDRNCTWADESYINNQFKKMHDTFVTKGYPVILGEYSSSVRKGSDYPGMDLEKHQKSRAAWNECLTRTAKNNGCIPFYWETGGDINRSNGTAINQYAIDAIMSGASAGVYPF